MSKLLAVAMLAAAVELTLASGASADLIAHESFDYPGNTADGQGGAANGWGGAWTLTQNGPDNFHRLAQPSLTYPAGVALTPSGGRISNMSDEVLRRSLATPISANPASPREVWISMLVQKSDGGSIEFGFERSSDGLRRLVWGFGHDEKIRVNVADAAPFFASSEAFPVDTPLLLVVRLSLTNGTTASADSIGVKVFKPGDAVVMPQNPEDFDIQQSNGTGITVDRFVIDGNNQVTQVDEIRIGDTFADVVPVPEPGAAALGGVGASLLLMRRP